MAVDAKKVAVIIAGVIVVIAAIIALAYLMIRIQFQAPKDTIETFLSLVDDGQTHPAYQMMTTSVSGDEAFEAFDEAFSVYSEPDFAFGGVSYSYLRRQGSFFVLEGVMEEYGHHVPLRAMLVRQPDSTFLFNYVRIGNKEAGRVF